MVVCSNMLLMMNLNKYSLRNCTPLAVKWQQTVRYSTNTLVLRAVLTGHQQHTVVLWYALK